MPLQRMKHYILNAEIILKSSSADLLFMEKTDKHYTCMFKVNSTLGLDMHFIQR